MREEYKVRKKNCERTGQVPGECWEKSDIALFASYFWWRDYYRAVVGGGTGGGVRINSIIPLAITGVKKINLV